MKEGRRSNGQKKRTKRSRKHGAALAQSLEDFRWSPSRQPHTGEDQWTVEMSCNGCRVLRKGCSDTCVLRTSLHWIDSPEAQGNATLFVAKFFGRSDLMSFISAVPDHQRPALFQSLLFEACGRTVNPVNGAVGLLSSGNWHVCQRAVETVLSGGVLRPILGILTPNLDESSESFNRNACMLPNLHYPSPPSIFNPKLDQAFDIDLSRATNFRAGGRGRGWRFPMEKRLRNSISMSSEESVTTTGFGVGDRKEQKLLNLFV
ncbi:hypothetical protein FNV43_RR11743 [Rhamnella rubrinervis]|uniref:LOB domain-containing protein n=1 Tax=Rhamnella rubrinervis TaxID=2594499 RepID=A0A8K0H6Z8_9ROSA|nr:hypothetical protein FNV43_RR11743 [Rhamnella rubrinervis]